MQGNPVEKLCKWRMVFAGWHIGTRLKTEPGVAAFRDTAEKLLLLRAEVSALAKLLIDKKIMTAVEFTEALHIEAAVLDQKLERFFDGYSTSNSGVDIDVKRASATNIRLGFPP